MSKLSIENAREIVNKIYEYYELDDLLEQGDEASKEELDTSAPALQLVAEAEEGDNKKALITAARVCYDRLVKHAMRCRLEVDDSLGFVVVQRLRTPMSDGKKEIRWREPTARAKLATSKSKSGNAEERMFLFMGAIGERVDAPRLQELSLIDYSLMEGLAAVFYLV